MFYVYMLECADNTLYTGYTVDLEKRLAAHNLGKASKYTRTRLPVRLIFSEACTDKSEALRREAAIKKLTRAEKLGLIREAAAAPNTDERARHTGARP